MDKFLMLMMFSQMLNLVKLCLIVLIEEQM